MYEAESPSSPVTEASWLSPQEESRGGIGEDEAAAAAASLHLFEECPSPGGPQSQDLGARESGSLVSCELMLGCW